MRNQLAVLDNNFHSERDQQVNSEGLPIVQAQVSRRTKEWVAYRKLTAKKYEYIPGLCAYFIACTQAIQYCRLYSQNNYCIDKVCDYLAMHCVTI